MLAGSTGALGLLIANHRRRRGATVRALRCPESRHSAEAESLRLQGAEVVAVAYTSVADLMDDCRGAACVVSALSGRRPVIVEAQTRLNGHHKLVYVRSASISRRVRRATQSAYTNLSCQFK